MTVRAILGTSLFSLACVIGIGCSAAPTGTDEASGSTSEALPKCTNGDCTPVIKDPPVKVKPPIVKSPVVLDPPTPTIDPNAPASGCTYDGVATALASGGVYHDPGGYWFPYRNVPASEPSPYHLMTSQQCAVNPSTDPLQVLHLNLMAKGCSTPVWFEAFNANGGAASGTGSCAIGGDWACWADKANGFFLLCPTDNAEINGMVTAAGTTSYNGQASDMAAHWALTTATAYGGPVPTAPAGHQWVSTWEDPHGCGSSGCMCFM